MSEIWKYHMERPDMVFDVPRGAKFHSVGLQDETSIVLWAEVDPNEDMEKRAFSAYNTGRKLPRTRDFVGTVMCYGIVWHVFEVLRSDVRFAPPADFAPC